MLMPVQPWLSAQLSSQLMMRRTPGSLSGLSRQNVASPKNGSVGLLAQGCGCVSETSASIRLHVHGMGGFLRALSTASNRCLAGVDEPPQPLAPSATASARNIHSDAVDFLPAFAMGLAVHLVLRILTTFADLG